MCSCVYRKTEGVVQKFIICADVIYEWSLRTKLVDVEFLELELGVGLTSVAVVGGLLRSVVVVLGGNSVGLKNMFRVPYSCLSTTLFCHDPIYSSRIR